VKHFSKDEWILYNEGQFTDEEKGKMEDHLTQCDYCLYTFLSLIDDEDIAQGEKSLSPNFDDKLFIKVKKMQGPIKRHKQHRERKKNLLIYYMAASIVTLVLMNGGLFHSFIEPEVFNASKRIENQVSVNWPEKVVKDAHNWILNFEVYGKGGFNIEQKK